MKKNNMVAMILAGGRGSRLFDLTKKVAKPAVHFGGKYRIIDFALSNCANSHISTVGVLVQYESILLSSYSARSSTWGLDSKGGGVYVLSPREKDETGLGLYNGTADAIYQNLDFLDQEEADYVLVLSGDHIYKMDYEKMLQAHIDTNAEATIAVIEVPKKEASRFGIMNTDKDDRIIEFEEKPKEPKSNLASMGVYIFSYKNFRKYLKEDAKNAESAHDFGKSIIPAYLADGLKLQAYRFKGYWKDVGTIDSLWEANMDLLKDNSGLDLFDPDWKIYTDDAAATPQCIGNKAQIDNAFITQGAIINGKVNHSVIFSGAEICEDAKVDESVIMNNVTVGKGAKLTRCLVADDVRIPEGMKLGDDKSKEILLVSKALIAKKVGAEHE
ncbi:MAG: glucose-1-phosphate adenylyltransferase [Erysipelotrichaceae bacterium]|nr:glucose-1-phosphate adenylyltransferase [Erysipelotrichaceae bacterium]MBQ6494156.1 glucose-1-phosphate adenylyltransferase [Erysipelotrichaceae bacterium]